MAGVARLPPDSSTGAGGLAGFVESLLSSVAGMGVQKSGRKRVVDLLTRLRREPVPGLPVDPVVLDQGGGVDASTLAIQGIGLVFGQAAGEEQGADHFRTIVLSRRIERETCLDLAKAAWLPEGHRDRCAADFIRS